MKSTICAAILTLLVGCGRDVKPDPPVPPPPVIVEVPVAHYVPVPDVLTGKCRWVRNAPLQDIFPVTRGRRHCLEVYEANIDAIRRIQGGAVAEDED